MYRELDAQVLKDVITKDFISLKDSFSSAIAERLKDISKEKFS